MPVGPVETRTRTLTSVSNGVAALAGGVFLYIEYDMTYSNASRRSIAPLQWLIALVNVSIAASLAVLLVAAFGELSSISFNKIFFFFVYRSTTAEAEINAIKPRSVARAKGDPSPIPKSIARAPLGAPSQCDPRSEPAVRTPAHLGQWLRVDGLVMKNGSFSSCFTCMAAAWSKCEEQNLCNVMWY